MSNTKTMTMILLFAAAGFMLLSAATYITLGMIMDNDNDQTPDILDFIRGSVGGVVDDDTGRIVISGAVDVNNDGDYDDGGDIKPAENATHIVVITSATMDSLYQKGHRLYDKIFLLPPDTEFNAYVTLEARGGDISDVSVEFYLEEGSLPKGYLMHVRGGKVVKMSEKFVESLPAGSPVTVTLPGRTPTLNPGHDWYLGLVVVKVKGKEVVRKAFWRDDNPMRYKWFTLKYPNNWCDVNTNWIEGCVDSTIGKGDLVTIQINKAERAVFTGISRAILYEITYPGKYVKVFDGKPDFTVVGNIYTIKIPKSNFASVQPNEAYMKLTLYDNNGRVIDLNKAADDVSARMNIDVEIIGGKAWTSEQEYFSSIGLFPRFFSLGGEEHPEALWFG